MHIVIYEILLQGSGDEHLEKSQSFCLEPRAHGVLVSDVVVQGKALPTVWSVLNEIPRAGGEDERNISAFH